MTLEKQGFELYGYPYTCIFFDTVQYCRCIFLVIFLVTFFPLAYFNVRIQYIVCIMYKTC